MSERLLDQLDALQAQIEGIEGRLKEVLEVTPQIRLLMTIPGVGLILASVMAFENGDVGRFASADRLASYVGTTPRVKSSGDKTRYGRLRPDVNHTLKWAFLEAANVLSKGRRHFRGRHALGLYGRIRTRKGHQKAIGAVGRHLAEAAFHVLSKKEPYRDPSLKKEGEFQGSVSASYSCGDSAAVHEYDSFPEQFHAPGEGEEMIRKNRLNAWECCPTLSEMNNAR